MSLTLPTSNPSRVTFSEFGLHENLVQTLTALGYLHPTPIQAKTIPPMLSGQDVLGTAQTGTGKTAAFALPMLQKIDLAIAKPQILVLAPTRELAIQVAESFERYAAGMNGLRVATIYGGQDYQVQFRQLERGAHVVVGTPGRLTDHLRRQTLSLANISGIVLDEADEMLRMGFQEDVEHILGLIPAERQMALFSATMPDTIRHIASQYMRKPAMIDIARRAATADTIRQRYLVAHPGRKADSLIRVLGAEETDGVLVFVKTRATCDPLADALHNAGYRTAALHGEVPQKQRERIIEDLKSGELNVIVATDVAARGLDVQRISHVFNYDLPYDHEAYVHRIGRTGRAGRAGQAILFVTPRERFKLRRIENATGQRIEPMDLPTNRDVNKKRLAEFHQRIVDTLSHKEMDAFTSIVEQFRRAHPDVPIEKVAAALGIMANDGKALFDRTEWQPATFEAESDRPRGNRFDRKPRAGAGHGTREDRRGRSGKGPAGKGPAGNGRSGGRRRPVSS